MSLFLDRGLGNWEPEFPAQTAWSHFQGLHGSIPQVLSSWDGSHAEVQGQKGAAVGGVWMELGGLSHVDGEKERGARQAESGLVLHHYIVLLASK